MLSYDSSGQLRHLSSNAAAHVKSSSRRKVRGTDIGFNRYVREDAANAMACYDRYGGYAVYWWQQEQRGKTERCATRSSHLLALVVVAAALASGAGL